MKIVLAKILLFSRKVSGEYQISSSESQNGLISNPKFDNICFPRVRKEKSQGEIWTLSIKRTNLLFFTRRHCQSNIETRWADIMQKRRTGFCGDKNFNLVVLLFSAALFFMWYSAKFSYSSFIHTFRHSSETYLRIGLGSWRHPPNENIKVR